MVPKGWKRLPLEQVAEVRSGIAKGKSGLKDPVTLPYLRVANVQDGHINLTDVKEIEIERDKINRYSLKKGDVLMNEGGDFDKLGRGDVWLGQIHPCLHQNHVFAVRPDANIMDSFFLAALAASNYGKTYFLSCAKRSTNLASINSRQIKEFPTLLPPLPEQKKIAQILSTWDKAITTTEQLLANNQQQKKALMQQLLTGKKRLLDKNGVRFSGEWEEINLGKSVKVIGGNAFKSEEFKECGIPVVRISNIKPDYSINMDSSIFVSEDSRFNRFKIINGDILIAMSGATTGKIGMYNLNTFSYLNQRVGKFEPIKGRASKNYLFQLFKQPKIQYNVLIDAVGGAQPNISNKDIERIKVLIPALSEQQKIAAVLSTADQEITVLQQKLNALKQEKKALMQQLLTGKRRVKVN
ncbi:MAG: restriction endonuclease subunit S [Thalassolituus sp.]|uniref:restriction endonuclease subunit S n=1 Tax=Thalassolituus sp. TaxID=2030822 RepID=UPI003982C02C